jgi:hypothetical protein
MVSAPPAFAPSSDGSAERASLAEASRAIFGTSPVEAAAAKWVALSEAAAVVAALAGQAPPLPATQDFCEAIRAATPWRREAAVKGIDDLAAIMEPGIEALLAVNARGADAQAPALALWREFCAARDALLALTAPAHA